MAAQYTFVPVDVSVEGQRDHVAPDYRSIIRSLSARNPWNRPIRGETIIPGLHTRPSHRKLAPRPPTRQISEPILRHKSLQRLRSSPPDAKLEEQESEKEAPLNSSTAPLWPPVSRPPDPYALPDHFLSRCHDPFWTFPIPYRPYMARIVEHRLSVTTRHLPILDDESTLRDPSKWALYQIWVESRDSPTYLYASLLQSGAFLCAANTAKEDKSAKSSATSPAISEQEHMLWLRLCAIRAINNDLRDPEILHHPRKYAKFAALLAAISTIASYEFHFGDHALQRAHHRAMVRLVRLHGGLQSLSELQRRFYIFILKVALLNPPSAEPGSEMTEFVATASALRGLLREPALQLGCEDLDKVLGPEKT